jgi:hypothetical protein
METNYKNENNQRVQPQIWQDAFALIQRLERKQKAGDTSMGLCLIQKSTGASPCDDPLPIHPETSILHHRAIPTSHPR